MAGARGQSSTALARPDQPPTPSRTAGASPALRGRPRRMITLVLDASTYDGDVAVLDDARVLAERRTVMRDALHERLMPAVAEALEAAGTEISRLDRIVCGAGPGSFTSLRIAASIAKGIAMATDTA